MGNMRPGKYAGMWESYILAFAKHALRGKRAPSEDSYNELICMHLATVEWAKRPPYIFFITITKY